MTFSANKFSKKPFSGLLKITFASALAMSFSSTTFADEGRSVYQNSCGTCHGAGIMGAPKYGSKDDWAPRLAQGVAKLEEHAIKGFRGKKGFMPAKGGNAGLSDEQVKAAVAHMLASTK